MTSRAANREPEISGVRGFPFTTDGATAVAGTQVIIISVPWASIDAAWTSLGDVGDVVIVDTTNPFGADGIVELPTTSAAFNARRFGERPYAKAFNTLTSAFQSAAIEKAAPHRAAMFYAASEQRAADVVEPLIASVGFVPIFVGGPAESALMEAPRRPVRASAPLKSPVADRYSVRYVTLRLCNVTMLPSVS